MFLVFMGWLVKSDCLSWHLVTANSFSKYLWVSSGPGCVLSVGDMTVNKEDKPVTWLSLMEKADSQNKAIFEIEIKTLVWSLGEGKVVNKCVRLWRADLVGLMISRRTQSHNLSPEQAQKRSPEMHVPGRDQSLRASEWQHCKCPAGPGPTCRVHLGVHPTGICTVGESNVAWYQEVIIVNPDHTFSAF